MDRSFRSLGMSLLPTPLEDAPRLAQALGIKRLLIKREDLSGTGLGGNKLRQIDLLLAEAIDQGATTVITTAGAQSNFCRALAAGSAKSGLRCILLLRGDPNEAITGNLLLDHMFGADVRFIPKLDPWSDTILELLDEVAEDERASGRTPVILHLPGRSAGLATIAWVQAARELDEQFTALGESPTQLFVAAGSGLTAAGLALGFKILGRGPRIRIISVQQPAARIGSWIIDVGKRASAMLGREFGLEAQDFDVDDLEIGAGYGVPTPQALNAMILAARTEALLLDPVYTGKAFAGLIRSTRDGDISPDTAMVFVHSGGTPGVFAHANAITAHLEAP